mmetsp:Transcript_7950/g.9860  ORF Transcript_7950/g.9860 Transcript_7950/m.9860 type:complete len:82 (+) Transcript_7950:40-285(+)|eukprot:CAMPEP_0206194244 /NCGR_PEP_ID=MMETSP0166-20121206/7072_1 /ASSEMBLY_ACC=CAM_ASM_000260 /TAXON_ID=95228 /ORGANISM="Vannella robusta, Strain DIVA3 518/3/11/1/6" /LENGTH=81 /DNA_ID=CAMNT_0053611161 /DNA_START=31 /DNA_END=276 /DNA_ORIENTATION=+
MVLGAATAVAAGAGAAFAAHKHKENKDKEEMNQNLDEIAEKQKANQHGEVSGSQTGPNVTKTTTVKQDGQPKVTQTVETNP